MDTQQLLELYSNKIFLVDTKWSYQLSGHQPGYSLSKGLRPNFFEYFITSNKFPRHRWHIQFSFEEY